MSALPLAEAGPISNSGAFYIPFEEASHAAETLSKTWEATPPAPSDTEKLEGAAAPPGGGFEIAVDLDWHKLHILEKTLEKWARESSGSGTRIPEETLCFLPGILRTVIQFVQEMQSQNVRLQGAKVALQAESRQMEAHISSLRAEIKMLQDAKEKCKYEIDVLKRDILKVKESCANLKAQKDSLEEQPKEIKTRAASDRSTGILATNAVP